jgi:hypothetical protein
MSADRDDAKFALDLAGLLEQFADEWAEPDAVPDRDDLFNLAVLLRQAAATLRGSAEMERGLDELTRRLQEMERTQDERERPSDAD